MSIPGMSVAQARSAPRFGQCAQAVVPRSRCFKPAAGMASQSRSTQRTALMAQRQEQRRRRRLPPTAASSDESATETEAAEDAAQQRARAAAVLVADTFLRSETCIGVGSGLQISCLLEELAARLSSGKLRSVKVVPASDAAAAEAALHGVPLTTLPDAGRLDFYFEAADELVDDAEGSLAFIIGRRQQPVQPQLHRARLLAAAATTNVVLASEASTVVPRLGGSLPVAVEEEEWEESAEQLDDIFLGDAELWRRSTEEGAGPRGGDSPYVSPEGHVLIDVRFYEGMKLLGEDADYGSIAREIDSVPGVVAHGLMANVAAAAVVVGADVAAGAALRWRGEPTAAAAGGADKNS